MPSTLIPTSTSAGIPPEEQRRSGQWTAGDANGEILAPHILIQLEDDLERSRWREAFWISVVVHMMVVILLVMSPKIFPGTKGVLLISPQDLMANKQLTYLDMPPDLQKEPKVVPEAKALSDKNRIAESRHPSLDKKTLEELRRAGPPRPPASPSQNAQMTAPSPAGQQQQTPQGQQQIAQSDLQPNPRLPVPQQEAKNVPNFAGMMSAGNSVEQAARAVATHRGGYGGGGGGGDNGIGPGGSAVRMGQVDVLSDTEGVDFGPYLSRVVDAVRREWYTLIPEAARPPLLKRGRVAIEFAILRDGSIAGIKYSSAGNSGDISLDRAAWGGITGASPFAPLPSAYHAPYLALRFRFYYNPQKGDIE
jgi:outer membrane biosynthesis protein TonB